MALSGNLVGEESDLKLEDSDLKLKAKYSNNT